MAEVLQTLPALAKRRKTNTLGRQMKRKLHQFSLQLVAISDPQLLLLLSSIIIS